MNQISGLFIKACRNCKVEYNIHHYGGNFIEAKTSPSLFMVNEALSFNSTAVNTINKDKDFQYNLLKDVVKMPRTIPFLDPAVNEKYKGYLNFFSINEIVSEIDSQFSYPTIIKRNRGSRGDNVYKCSNKKSISKFLKIIFDKTKRNYDYVALAQEYINKKSEYRVIVWNKKIQFVYEKSIEDATSAGNLSPLHQDGSRAILVTDKNLVKKIREFIAPIFQKYDLVYGGLDIIVDKNNELFLLEVNSRPGFNYFLRDCQETPLVDMFEKMLRENS